MLGSTWRTINLPLRGANRHRGLKIVVLLDPDDRAPEHARPNDAARYAQDRDQLQQPLAHDRYDGQQQQQSRERHPGIDEPLHHQVKSAAKESRGAADQNGDQNVERGGCQTHRQGNPGAVEKGRSESERNNRRKPPQREVGCWISECQGFSPSYLMASAGAEETGKCTRQAPGEIEGGNSG